MAMKDNTSEFAPRRSRMVKQQFVCTGVSVLTGSRLDQLRANRLP